MLSYYSERVKSFIEQNKSDLFVAALIFLAGMGSFGLGRLSVVWPKKDPVRIIESKGGFKEFGLPASIEASPLTGRAGSPASLDETAAGVFAKRPGSISASGPYVASKSGKYYHYPWCPGSLRIKEANKIWFQTKEDAEKKGYKPASNCQGL